MELPSGGKSCSNAAGSGSEELKAIIGTFFLNPIWGRMRNLVEDIVHDVKDNIYIYMYYIHTQCECRFFVSTVPIYTLDIIQQVGIFA